MEKIPWRPGSRGAGGCRTGPKVVITRGCPTTRPSGLPRSAHQVIVAARAGGDHRQRRCSPQGTDAGELYALGVAGGPEAEVAYPALVTDQLWSRYSARSSIAGAWRREWSSAQATPAQTVPRSIRRLPSAEDHAIPSPGRSWCLTFEVPEEVSITP